MMYKKVFNEYCDFNYFCQTGCFFSHIFKEDEAVFATSDFVKSLLWNHIFVWSDFDKKKLYSYKDKFARLTNQATAFYIYENDYGNQKLLENEGYILQDIEAWMIIEKIPRNKSRLTVNEVNNDNYKEFMYGLSTQFDEEYSRAFEYECKNGIVGKTGVHLLFYDKDRYIGHGSIYFLQEVSFIHNVGVFEEYRHKGYSAEIIKELLSIAADKNPNRPVLLQCNGGPDGHEHVYEKSGFRVIFRRKGYQING